MRRFYVDLLALCQDSAVRGNGYWGLKYFNRPQRFDDCPAKLYSFARYQEHAGRLLLVMANFRAGSQLDGGCAFRRSWRPRRPWGRSRRCGWCSTGWAGKTF